MECKNCQSELWPEQPYCSECGAKVIRNRLTIRNITNDFSAQFLNYDNRFLQTFLTMFGRPEAVIDGYVNGLRKRYMNVLGYFAVAITVARFSTYVLNKFFPGRFEALYQGMAADEASAQASIALYQFVSEYQTFIMFAFIPIFAGLTRLVFWNYKKYNYSEHLVLNMYTYSHVSILTSALTIISQLDERLFSFNAIASIFIQILIYAYVLKRVFELNLARIVLKTLFFLLLLIPLYIILIILVGVAMFLFTDYFDTIIEAAKAQKNQTGS
jgi:hypothetical protein